jgi:hypothetical protein
VDREPDRARWTCLELAYALGIQRPGWNYEGPAAAASRSGPTGSIGLMPGWDQSPVAVLLTRA